MGVEIRAEGPGDFVAIRAVHREAFGRDDEGRLVDALRGEGYVRLSLVAEDTGCITGNILFSHLRIETEQGTVDALALAPLAVTPRYQRQGIGSRLVREGLCACTDLGHTIVVVVGHTEFYPRFGFSAKLAEPLSAPFPGDSFMALELVPRALNGVFGTLKYALPFE